MEYRDGDLITTTDGEVMQYTSCCTLWQRHGGVVIGDTIDIPLFLFSILAGEETLRFFSFRQALFLDIETAMINGENIAVMVGVGAFETEQFSLRQLFITHPTHERGLLSLLRMMVRSRPFLVTFNGKLFDVPFLDARFRRYGSTPFMHAVPHLDLLPIARRFWKNILPDCRLKTIETERLGVERYNDLPSSMIPSQYRRFLETDESFIVGQILLHNRFDVLSLLGIVNVLACSLYQPTRTDRQKGELIACGQEFLRLGHAELAVIYLETAVKEASVYEWEALCSLAQAYSRLRRWDKACSVWKDLLSKHPLKSSRPYVELAKHYERRRRHYVEAAKLMERAVRNFPQERKTLMSRWERLRKKLSGAVYQI